jgi:ABC-type nitrate/sulfonate/bicarbonate transport system substrate-binding protein
MHRSNTNRAFLLSWRIRYPATALATTDAFVRNRPQTLNRFLRATLEGIKYAKATVRVLGQYTRNTIPSC